ncbi:MAG: right-handed parallel beta-helix repeat-containing protein, partial [Bacteroidota bacterium]
DSIFPVLDLQLTDKNAAQIEKKRKEAQLNGVLITGPDSWVKGKILLDNQKVPVKLRLKGDWTDHLNGEKTSFRIRTRLPETWNRMHTFSIQDPSTRYFLHEWVFHQMLLQEDILTTRYDFLHLKSNGLARGIFAYEEHFEKILVEQKSRREGPIVKFNEDGLWHARRRSYQRGHVVEVENNLNAYAASEIEGFSEAATEAMQSQLEQARILMDQFRFGKKKASEIFDIEKTARYYAIVDLHEAYHNLIWHNLRYYFNPITLRLEPIGFDGFTETGVAVYTHLPLIGATRPGASDQFQGNLHANVFQDPVMAAAYLKALYEITDPFFIEHFFTNHENALDQREKLLQSEYADYAYKREDLRKRARKIRTLLKPLEGSALKIFTRQKNGQQAGFALHNYHLLPLEVIGFGTKANEMTQPLAEPLFLLPHERGKPPVFQDLIGPASARYVFFRLPGLEETYTIPISASRPVETESLRQKLFAKFDLSQFSFLNIQGDRISIPAGTYQLDQDLIIPAGKELWIAPGVEIDLVKKAAFLSQSPIYLEGTEEAPIYIHSSDQTGNGWSVLQATKVSRLTYVRFEDLNTLVRPGWTLTGAVNFFESEVEIDHCEFVKNHCEDGLNIVRSTFSLNASLISQTFADGFDADFCQGSIRNTRFVRTGNDGMDFSGSRITVHSCRIEQAGDKGISVGEEATVTIKEAIIDGANIGVASKDLSVLRVSKLSMKNCRIGFSAYQKKPEYGPAQIYVDEATIDQIGSLHQIERGSLLRLAGEKVSGI